MFDSPFFWIVAIWWLLSNVLGKGKRRKVRQVEPLPMEESEDYLYEEPLVDDPFSAPGPGTVEPEPDRVEPESQPVYPQVPPPLAPLKSTLKDLWRTLERELGDPAPPVASVPVQEPSIQPREPVEPPPPAPPKVVERVQPREHDEVEVWGTTTTTFRQPLERYSSRWTTVQQAVIFREIIGPPLALRRRGRR